VWRAAGRFGHSSYLRVPVRWPATGVVRAESAIERSSVDLACGQTLGQRHNVKTGRLRVLLTHSGYTP
jgi:hypothetical protein